MTVGFTPCPRVLQGCSAVEAGLCPLPGTLQIGRAASPPYQGAACYGLPVMAQQLPPGTLPGPTAVSGSLPLTTAAPLTFPHGSVCLPTS